MLYTSRLNTSFGLVPANMHQYSQRTVPSSPKFTSTSNCGTRGTAQPSTAHHSQALCPAPTAQKGLTQQYYSNKMTSLIVLTCS
jgi:hypothetical protein